VDGLLDAGYQRVTVLDLAPGAPALSQQRLGKRSELVNWITANILDVTLQPGKYAA
jgi:hypothetical protein